MNISLTPLRCLYRAVDLYGRKVGVVCGDERFTYAQFGERCERLAFGLQSEGVKAGDRVAFLSFNTHQLLEGYFGPILIHAIAMPLNVRLTQLELTQILNHAEASVLVFEADFAPMVEAFRRSCPSIRLFVSTDARAQNADLSYEELLSLGRLERPDFLAFDENEIAEVFYTSGSTGTPKGVMLSHRTLYLHAISTGNSVRDDETTVALHTIPLFHANGWGKPQSATMMGARHVMVRRFEPLKVLELIQQERATCMLLVPVMANALLNCPQLGQFDTSSLVEIQLGGAASSPELLKRLEAAFGCHVYSGYGLTETAPIATLSRLRNMRSYERDEQRHEISAMAGVPVVGTEIRVVDANGVNVPQDMQTVGEVLARGDNIMDGYFREPEATAAVMEGGWLHTGDMAVWDEESGIQIVDRKKDIIISGGENISSIEIEKAIFAHPKVFECAVVAAPDQKWGEVPVAIVVLKPDESLTALELAMHLEERLAKFKLPRQVEFVAGPLPKTGTGKILKRELREAYWVGKERRVQGPEAVVVASSRTGLAKSFRGSFNRTRPEDLAAHCLRDVLRKTPLLDPAEIEDVILGCAQPHGPQGANVARRAAVLAGLPVTVGGTTVNRFCSSGLQAIAMAAHEIIHEGAEAAIGGGVESISLVPRDPDRHLQLAAMKPGLYMEMGVTAEVVARRYSVTRAAQDEYSLISQQRTARAQVADFFASEIAPMAAVMGLADGGTQDGVCSRDECNRPTTTLEGLAALKPVFDPDSGHGSVTAGNSSQLSDGASATLLMSRERADELGIPYGLIYRGFAVAGCEPDEMGIGPIFAVPKLLGRHGLDVLDIDLWELNEAFAVQVIYCRDRLGIPMERLNVNGGSISIGHPFGMTGSRMVGTLANQMLRMPGARYGVVTMCVGGGQGAAGLFEAVR